MIISMAPSIRLLSKLAIQCLLYDLVSIHPRGETRPLGTHVIFRRSSVSLPHESSESCSRARYLRLRRAFRHSQTVGYLSNGQPLKIAELKCSAQRRRELGCQLQKTFQELHSAISLLWTWPAV